jgi:hypothetical protein
LGLTLAAAAVLLASAVTAWTRTPSSFGSGTPGGVSLTTITSADLTGGGDGQRVLVVGDPRLSHGERGLLQIFKTSAFAMPGMNDPGNMPRVMQVSLRFKF